MINYCVYFLSMPRRIKLFWGAMPVLSFKENVLDTQRFSAAYKKALQDFMEKRWDENRTQLCVHFFFFKTFLLS